MTAARRRFGPALAAALLLGACRPSVSSDTFLIPDERLPLTEGSVRFAVIGDSGTGRIAQREIASRLWEAHQRFPFDFVVMLGDNMYGRERPQDYAQKFQKPYQTLLDAGIEFYAALGNHDDPNQRYYELFNMKGERFYTFTHGNVKFFALDSNYMDEKQLEWLERELEGTKEDWKIAFLHHPLYSSGARHGSEVDLRERVEPLFVAHDVKVVFAGHEHFYERIKPQQGIHHFISGAAAKLRYGNIRRTDLTARGFDTDYSFMLVEVVDDALYFETVSRMGRLVDAGAIQRVPIERVAQPETSPVNAAR